MTWPTKWQWLKQWQRQIQIQIQRPWQRHDKVCEIVYISVSWEPDFRTIIVTWQLRVTLDSIRNSCDVCFQLRKPFLQSSLHCNPLKSCCILEHFLLPALSSLANLFSLKRWRVFSLANLVWPGRPFFASLDAHSNIISEIWEGKAESVQGPGSLTWSETTMGLLCPPTDIINDPLLQREKR